MSLSDVYSAAEILSQPAFFRTLAVERKRTERSNRPFILMLVTSEMFGPGPDRRLAFGRVMSALTTSIRETDVRGWYDEKSTLGVIFTEIGSIPADDVIKVLWNKVSTALADTFDPQELKSITISFHTYPEDHSFRDTQNPEINRTLYPDLDQPAHRSKVAVHVKRAIDISGSLLGLLISAPVFILIAILIKLTSRGPVFFRQPRLGRHGEAFTFLKFRSMFVNNDPTIHKEYVTQLIAAKDSKKTTGPSNQKVYKLTADPRVTSLGQFLRRTSLDELPQFLNVLKGDMSLVGPRPPIIYEFGAYEVWHRRRLLEVKPGITGLWQVTGRSRVTFDEMVRLDLQYARSWSVMLDLKILLRTPGAVLTGQGAY